MVAGAGIVLFDFLSVTLLGLSSPREVTILIVLSTALCYFLVGLLGRWQLSMLGSVLALVVVIRQLLLPEVLYLLIAVFGGGTFLWSGVSILRQKRC